MDLLSGDQKKLRPPSVPSSGCDSRSRRLRIQSFPSFSYATALPSGDNVGSPSSVPETRTAARAAGGEGAALCEKNNQEETAARSARRAQGRAKSQRVRDRDGASCEEVPSG